jgi:tetratricopeptide (TPR) repeat protein
MTKKAHLIMALAAALIAMAAAPWLAVAQQAPPQAQVKAAKGISKQEAEGFNAINKAQTPDEKIKAADDFVAKFADSQFKGIALNDAAEAADQKGDWTKAIVYAEEAMKADPSIFEAKLLAGGEIAQHTRENDLDRDEKLAKAEKYVKEALDAIPTAVKPQAAVKDDQWEGYKKYETARAHIDLGLIAMARKKTDVQIAEFKMAVDMMDPPDSVAMARLANAYNDAGKSDDALAVLNKVLAMTDLNPAVKNFATAEKARAEKAKGGK